MASPEDELGLGKSGFMINPIEVGQTFYTQKPHRPDRTRVFEVLSIRGNQVQLMDEGQDQVLTADIEGLARRGRIGRYKVVDILVPSKPSFFAH